MAEYPIYLSEPLRKIGDHADSIDSTGTVTRQIRKLVLTGTESITTEPSNSNVFKFSRSDVSSNGLRRTPLFCTHYTAIYDGRSFDNLPYDSIYTGAGGTGGTYIYIYTDAYNTSSAFKAYLADQYAAGTPVTVWYVLSTPIIETTTVPIIQTIQGNNTLTIDTELKPSLVSISGTGLYTEIDKIPITGTNKEIKHGLDENGNYFYKSKNYYNWNNIRDIVRAGKAPNYYPLGSIIYDNFNSSTGTAFQVIAYDKHFDPNLTAQGYTHSMTLCELLLTDVYVFDNIEAFLFTETSIPAGTYKFTIPNYDATYGGNKTYYFTSTANIPEKTQIVMNWPYNQTPKTVSAYASNIDTTRIPDTTAITGFDALALYEYIDGESPEAVDLGTIAGPSTQLGTSNYGQMNHIHRARYGSNNYLQSGLRLYLNSTSAANTWWEMQTIFDRPYSQITQNGKLTKLNQNLVNVLATPTIQSRTNSYFETPSLDGTTFTLSTNYNIATDKMFLLSPNEVNLNADTTVGTILDYYTNADNNKRIKLRKSNNTAYYWWLRTPYPSNAHRVRYVTTSGALNSNLANNSYGAAPACTIQ